MGGRRQAKDGVPLGPLQPFWPATCKVGLFAPGRRRIAAVPLACPHPAQPLLASPLPQASKNRGETAPPRGSFRSGEAVAKHCCGRYGAIS